MNITTPGGHQPEIGAFVDAFRKLFSTIVRPRKMGDDDRADKGTPVHATNVEVLYRRDNMPRVMFRAITRDEKEVTTTVDLNLALSNNVRASEAYVAALLTKLQELIETNRRAEHPIILPSSMAAH